VRIHNATARILQPVPAALAEIIADALLKEPVT
jgi:hypothetical protein